HVNTCNPNDSRTACEPFEEIIFTTEQPRTMGNKHTHIEPLIIAYQSSTERPAETLWNAPWFADLTLQVRSWFEGSLHSNTSHRQLRVPLSSPKKPTGFGSL
ncbi:hypothetical protein AVEN_33414-1, partial [Araneus ventricosus]